MGEIANRDRDLAIEERRRKRRNLLGSCEKWPLLDREKISTIWPEKSHISDHDHRARATNGSDSGMTAKRFEGKKVMRNIGQF